MEEDADTDDVTAAVLSPISDAWQTVPAVPTVTGTRRITVLASSDSPEPSKRPTRALAEVPVDFAAHALVHGDSRRWRGPPLSNI